MLTDRMAMALARPLTKRAARDGDAWCCPRADVTGHGWWGRRVERHCDLAVIHAILIVLLALNLHAMGSGIVAYLLMELEMG